MKGSNSNNCNNAETIKVIVEAQLPKKGQKLSSGGVRENGKIASQYKHPQRYIEPPKKSAVKPKSNRYKEKVKSYVEDEALDFVGGTVHMALNDIGKPVLHELFQNITYKIVDALTEDKTSEKRTKTEKPNEKVTKSTEERENIVHFPDERVG